MKREKCRHDLVLVSEWDALTLGWRHVATLTLDIASSKTRVMPSGWDRMVCIACGAWLSLGLANDEPDAVKVEMRAAELARLTQAFFKRESNNILRVTTGLMADIDGAELAGMIIWNCDSAKQPDQDGELAGYLAACTTSHKEEP